MLLVICSANSVEAVNLFAQLEAVPKDDDFQVALGNLTAAWTTRGVGLEGVEAILAFIEQHRGLDLGAPGPLVHFAEKFYRKGYETALLTSFTRRPTSPTAWMLNRMINGTQDAAELETYIQAFERAEADPATDPATRGEITHYLGREA